MLRVNSLVLSCLYQFTLKCLIDGVRNKGGGEGGVVIFRTFFSGREWNFCSFLINGRGALAILKHGMGHRSENFA